ncbi:MAG: hypothetical protein WC254_04665 [Candidatus Woesearchaeota archaeon]|jgi:hypothetical protein
MRLVHLTGLLALLAGCGQKPSVPQNETSLNCSAVSTPTGIGFANDLYTALGSSSYKKDDDNALSEFYDQTKDYVSLVSLVVNTFPDVISTKHNNLFCEAKNLAVTLNSQGSFEKDVIEAAYKEVAFWVSRDSISLADHYLTFGNKVAEQSAVDTNLYAGSVVEAAYNKAAFWVDRDSISLADPYLTFGNKVAEQSAVDTNLYAGSVVEAAYNKAAFWVDRGSTGLADPYLAFGNKVAEQSKVDTNLYAGPVVEAACKKVAFWVDNKSPTLVDGYLTYAATVAQENKSTVCQ